MRELPIFDWDLRSRYLRYRSIISSRSSKLPFHFLHAFCVKVSYHWPFFARVAYVAAAEELKHARYSILFAADDVLSCLAPCWHSCDLQVRLGYNYAVPSILITTLLSQS